MGFHSELDADIRALGTTPEAIIEKAGDCVARCGGKRTIRAVRDDGRVKLVCEKCGVWAFHVPDWLARTLGPCPKCGSVFAESGWGDEDEMWWVLYCPNRACVWHGVLLHASPEDVMKIANVVCAARRRIYHAKRWGVGALVSCRVV